MSTARTFPHVLVMLLALSGGAAAQTATAPDPIGLARSAAPASVAAEAHVWLLEPHGYRQVVAGTNGWTCLIERDHPDSVAPICYDPEGTRTLVPGVRRLEELRARGLGYRAAADSVEAEYAAGLLPVPSRPVIALMLSRHQVLYATPEGPRVGAWRPHVMIYQPGLRDADFALPEGFAPVSVGGTGHVFSYIVVPVADWSDEERRSER